MNNAFQTAFPFRNKDHFTLFPFSTGPCYKCERVGVCFLNSILKDCEGTKFCRTCIMEYVIEGDHIGFEAIVSCNKCSMLVGVTEYKTGLCGKCFDVKTLSPEYINIDEWSSFSDSVQEVGDGVRLLKHAQALEKGVAPDVALLELLPTTEDLEETDEDIVLGPPSKQDVITPPPSPVKCPRTPRKAGVKAGRQISQLFNRSPVKLAKTNQIPDSQCSRLSLDDAVAKVIEMQTCNNHDVSQASVATGVILVCDVILSTARAHRYFGSGCTCAFCTCVAN